MLNILRGLFTSLMSGGLYVLGGQINKLFRWCMGFPIGFIMSIGNYSWLWVSINTVLSGLAYLIATNAFSYGEKSWTTKLFGPWVSMGLSGLTYGACSFIFLPWYFALGQTVLSTVAFLGIKYLDDKDIVKNPWVEILRGISGTIMYVCN